MCNTCSFNLTRRTTYHLLLKILFSSRKYRIKFMFVNNIYSICQYIHYKYCGIFLMREHNLLWFDDDVHVHWHLNSWIFKLYQNTKLYIRRKHWEQINIKSMYVVAQLAQFCLKNAVSFTVVANPTPYDGHFFLLYHYVTCYLCVYFW